MARDKFKIMSDLNNALGKANELFMELRLSIDKPVRKPVATAAKKTITATKPKQTVTNTSRPTKARKTAKK